MSIHIKIFKSDAAWNAAKAGLEAAGHDLATDAVSEVTKLETAVIKTYPALADAFKTGFDEVENDKSVTGVAKMEKVVLGILPKVPEIAAEIADLPNLKDFLIKVGQTVFTDGLSALETEAAKLVTVLL